MGGIGDSDGIFFLENFESSKNLSKWVATQIFVGFFSRKLGEVAVSNGLVPRNLGMMNSCF